MKLTPRTTAALVATGLAVAAGPRVVQLVLLKLTGTVVRNESARR